MLTSKLNLPFPPTIKHLLVFDSGHYAWRTVEGVERNQNLRNAVICEYGDFVDISKFTKRLAIEAGPQVGD